jgi:hypothetical protein
LAFSGANLMVPWNLGPENSFTFSSASISIMALNTLVLTKFLCIKSVSSELTADGLSHFESRTEKFNPQKWYKN